MKLISSQDDVYNIIQKIKQNGKSYLTNFFIDQEKLNNWLLNEQFYCVEVEEGALFFRKNNEFYHLYYCTNSLDNLSVLLSKYIPGTIIVGDIIGKTQDVELVNRVFSDTGFKVHTTLERYTRINRDGCNYYELNSKIEIATELDSPRITEMLQKNFDKYSEQVYTLQDVNTLIQHEKIIMVKESGIIKGFLIRNILPQSSVLNNFLVDPEFRGEKIGLKLLEHYICESKDTKRMWLWVIKGNEPAINLYKKHGYENDGLVDLVMILNNTNEQNN